MQMMCCFRCTIIGHLKIFRIGNAIAFYITMKIKKLIEKAGLKVRFQTQVQRYPLANHLYWLVYGKPGGHVQWNFLRSDLMDKEYEHMLVGIGKADTLVVEITKCDN